MSLSDLARNGLARVLTAAEGVRVTGPDGAPPSFPDQAIYYANHSSHLDFVTLWSVMPPRLRRRVRPIAAKDYWGSGIKQKVAEGVFNAYLVDRHGSGKRGGSDQSPPRASSAGASPKGSGQLAGMTAVLDGGDSLIIFPEGTRGDGERVARFHGGLYRLALHDPSIPVIPVTLRDLGRILPKGEVIPVPHLPTVVVHAPLTVGPGESQEDFLNRARDVLDRSLRGQDHDDEAAR